MKYLMRLGLIIISLMGAYLLSYCCGKNEIKEMESIKKFEYKKVRVYSKDNKTKKFGGLSLTIFSILYIIYSVIISNSAMNFETLVADFVLFIIVVLFFIIGLGLVVLDNCERKGEDAASINVYVGKQLFEKGLNGIVIGVIVGSFTFFLNSISSLLNSQ